MNQESQLLHDKKLLHEKVVVISRTIYLTCDTKMSLYCCLSSLKKFLL